MIIKMFCKNKILQLFTVLICLIVLIDAAAAFSDIDRNGFCKHITDRTVIVSVFASDKEAAFNDAKKETEVLGYLDIACKYIKDECKRFGAETDFIYSNDADLVQHECFDTVLSDMTRDTTLIDEYIYSEKSKRQKLLKRYGAHSILYMFYVNSADDNRESSVCYMWIKDGDPEDEFCVINTKINGKAEGPAAYAHEILHAFGAVDLYPDSKSQYEINDLNWCKEDIDKNDIMFSVYDISTGEAKYDRITNSMSETDAYYLGIFLKE